MTACPRYSGQGAKAGNATCQFFTAIDAHPGVKWTAMTVCVILLLLCLRYLRTGKVFW